MTKAVAKGFAPIVYVQTAPRWAALLRAACRRPGELAQFDGRPLAATRGRSRTFLGFGTGRSGTMAQPGRILVPQYANGRPASPDWYRSMVNAAVGAIHSVRKDNVVVAGGLSPFGPGRASGTRSRR